MGFWQFATGGGSGGGTGDVVGPASSTDNAVARWDLATGKLLQNSDLTVSDLAAGAITITAGKGTAITLKNTDPDATTGASVAGDALAITAGNAVASTDTDGAAAGGALTLTSGNAARRTSGNAAGGDLVITPGEPIGTGVPGRIWLNYATAASDQVYATPRLVLNRLANTGFGAYETANLISFVGGNPYINLKANDTSVTLLSGIVLNFGAPSLTANGDVGLARSAAGVVKVTDGSTGIRGLLGGGTSVASASALPVPTGRVFHVTGTTSITSITSTNFQAGAVITLIFDDVLTFTDGNNLKLAGDFTTSADDTITLAYDGTNWYECSRSVN